MTKKPNYQNKESGVMSKPKKCKRNWRMYMNENKEFGKVCFNCHKIVLDKDIKPKQLDWENKLDEFSFAEWGLKHQVDTSEDAYGRWHSFYDKDLISFIQNELSSQKQQILESILKHNKDDMTGFYDYDGIAEEVINLVKK